LHPTFGLESDEFEMAHDIDRSRPDIQLTHNAPEQIALQPATFGECQAKTLYARLHEWAHCDDLALASDLLHSIMQSSDAIDIIKILARDFYDDQERIAERLVGSRLAPRLAARNKTVGVYLGHLRTGSIQRVVALLTYIWKNAGCSVVVFTDEPPHEDDYNVCADTQRVALPEISASNPTLIEARLNALSMQLKIHDVGIFVHNSVRENGFLFDLLTIKTHGIPVVALDHATFAVELSFQSTHIMPAKKRFTLLDSLIVLSSCDKTYWRLFDVPAEYIPNPLQWNINETKPSNLESKNILWIGRLSFEKRIFDALEIISEVIKKEPDAKLLIVGKGEAPEDLIAVQNKINEMRLCANVELCGYHLDVAPFYQNAAVYLHTSQFESFSMTLLESKAHGVPGVVYDLPNLELLRFGRGAMIVKQRDTRSAARAIISLLRDDDYRMDMGRVARQRLEEFLAATDISKAWADLFDNLGHSVEENLNQGVTKDAFRNNIETMFNCIRAGMEWRDEHYLPKWEVKDRYMTRSAVHEKFTANSQLHSTIHKTTRKGLAGRLQRLGDSLRKRLSTRPRAKNLPLEKRLQRHARFSRQLTNILGAYALVATIALWLR